MIFSYNWLQSFFKKKLPNPEKLAEVLTMAAFEVSEVKKSGKDFSLDIDILPNRAPDCFSHLGIARECTALLGYKLQVTNYKPKEDKKLKSKDFVKTEVKDKKACPRYTARVITDVKVGPSPKWLKEKLEVCGLQSINNIVDAANYMMLETGQPLHAFDFDKIKSINPKFGQKSKTIIIRKAKKDEKIFALDGETYKLNKDVLIIADSEAPLAIAGIKGGKKAEIDKNTKNIVLESANFNSITIAKSSKKLNLRTDASLRFEHGIDSNLTEMAVNRVVGLILEITKGKVAKGLIDFYPKKLLPRKIRLDLNLVEKLIGRRISEKEIRNIFKRLGFRLISYRHPYLTVEIPTIRLDVSLPEDLTEEIARIYGYNKIPGVYPLAALIPPQRNLDIFWEDMSRNILKDMGFTEFYNYSFISKKEAEVFNFKNLLEVENPLSADYQYLRPSLLPGLLKNVAKNQNFYRDIKIFELGKIFKKEEKKEKRMISGIMTGDAFLDAKGVIDVLFNKLGIAKVWYDEFKPTPEESKISCWVQKKCAEIKVNQEEIGFLGEISSKIMGKLKITNKVVAFDLDFEKLSQLASEEHEFRPISAYPAAIQDIAVLVPRDVSVEDVLNKIEITGGKLVRDVDLFDIYEGEEMPEGKKNLAFHIIYQAEDRTLSSKEIDKIHKKIISALEENSEWQVRK
jgi:phenylalanyl-tRNA synthetase beta chain